jgi:hypothetical protein
LVKIGGGRSRLRLGERRLLKVWVALLDQTGGGGGFTVVSAGEDLDPP